MFFSILAADAVVWVSTHSRPKAADIYLERVVTTYQVSTHSRPKAAEHHRWHNPPTHQSFNTQPPEGG